MSAPWSSSNRWIRYGSPVVLIIVSVLIAAIEVNQVGNDIQVAGTAIGLVWLIATLGRDMGMGTRSGHRSHVPDPPTGPATRRRGSDDGQPPVSPSK